MIAQVPDQWQLFVHLEVELQELHGRGDAEVVEFVAKQSACTVVRVCLIQGALEGGIRLIVSVDALFYYLNR